MIESILNTDYHLLDVDKMVAIHQYPTVTDGFEVWSTSYSDNRDNQGNFNRYCCWGPFADLVQLLEQMNIMDNKISVEYDGLFIGFYDGKVRIGRKCWHVGDHSNVIKHDEIRKRYEIILERRKKGRPV